MLKSSYVDEKSEIAIDVENEEQLVVESVLLIKEIKKQLMFKLGREEGVNTFNALIQAACK